METDLFSPTEAPTLDIIGDSSLQRPVFYVHGVPGSRVEARILHDVARDRGISILAFDRPGYGDRPLSVPGRLTDLAQDIRYFARTLQLPSYCVLGVSGGGPHALACGASPSDEKLRLIALVSSLGRCTSLRSVGGMHLMNRAIFSAAMTCPPLARLLLRLVTLVNKRAPHLLVWWPTLSSLPLERSLMNNAEIASSVRENFKRALSRGCDGLLSDVALLTQEWGFTLSNVEAPVMIWHGLRDKTVPPEMAAELALELPHCTTNFVPEWGHFMGIHCAGQILDSLASTAWP